MTTNTYPMRGYSYSLRCHAFHYDRRSRCVPCRRITSGMLPFPLLKTAVCRSGASFGRPSCLPVSTTRGSEPYRRGRIIGHGRSCKHQLVKKGQPIKISDTACGAFALCGVRYFISKPEIYLPCRGLAFGVFT